MGKLEEENKQRQLVHGSKIMKKNLCLYLDFCLLRKLSHSQDSLTYGFELVF